MYTRRKISDSSHLEETSDWAAESLPHVSQAKTITDNHNSVIQCTREGCYNNKAKCAANLFFQTVSPFVVTVLFSPPLGDSQFFMS